MRFSTGLVLLVLSMAGDASNAQTEATRSLHSLLAEGFEIKAMGNIGRPIFFVQKGANAYICEFPTLPTDKNLYGLILGTAICSRVRAS